jgi:hydrogenase-4 component B
VLAPTWLAVVLPAYLMIAGALVWTVLRPPLRRAPVWLSGTAAEVAVVQYTPAAYSNPVRYVLRGLYGFRRRVGRAEPERAGGEGAPVLETTTVPAFEHYVYGPLTRGALRVAAVSRRLQSGRLGTYLLYMLVLLLVVLALIPALHD